MDVDDDAAGGQPFLHDPPDERAQARDDILDEGDVGDVEAGDGDDVVDDGPDLELEVAGDVADESGLEDLLVDEVLLLALALDADLTLDDRANGGDDAGHQGGVSVARIKGLENEEVQYNSLEIGRLSRCDLLVR